MSLPPAGTARTRSPRRRGLVLALALLLFAGGTALAVPAVHSPILSHLGGLLVSEDPLAAADLIVIAPDAGDAGVLEAADLVRGGTAAHVTVLGDPPDEVVQEFARRGIVYEDAPVRMVDLLRRLGVQRVEVVRLAASGTEAAGRVIPDLARRGSLRTVVVVTGTDHSRRVQRVLRRSMRGGTGTVVLRPSRYSEFNAARWWKDKGTRRRGVVELQKLLLDVLRHPLS